MIDLDGTIYQTLDLKERAWHATSSNTRSVGVEIANIGTFDDPTTGRAAEWYQRDASGQRRIVVPDDGSGTGIRSNTMTLRPARPQPVQGMVQGQNLQQYDFTPQQYESLIKLTAALCKTFPKLKCDYPRGADGTLVREKLPDKTLELYQGVLGHYHIQSNKVDPGPAMNWEKVIGEARRLMK